MKANFKKYFMEFLGTFFLVFTVGCTMVIGSSGVIPAIAIGAVLMIMVYAGGYVSGGHYNPAVSLAVAMKGDLLWRHLIPYWIVQVLGGACAAFIVSWLVNGLIPVLPTEFNIISILIGEFLFTFALAFVVLHTATAARTMGNSYFGLAIGATVMSGIFAVGGICPAAFNPAVALGVGFLGIVTWKTVVFTIISNILGAIAAAAAFCLTSFECKE